MNLTGRGNHRHITSFQVIILGFFSVILTGGLLLTLPAATQDGCGATFADGIFTATSAVCVTGLVVHDTATYWSVFGQAVILLLIQTGGMGVVTVAIAIATASGRKIGLMQRSVMQEAISAHQVGGIVRMTKFILKTTVVVELAGAALLAVVFCRDFGMAKGIWYGLFHSVSAFCNAGFDLIVTGGLGFLTWADIQKNKWHFKKYRMQSKVILSMTAGLILIPAVYFFFFEFSDMAFGERIWCSLFQSVTPRTAGFNTADLTLLSETGLMVMIVLMLIGGSPGSTAGGMKTTTVAVLFSSALAVFRQKESAHVYGRRIADDAVKNAATILLLYVTLFLGGGMVISSIERIPLVTALFETGSAIGTVGLSLGVTPTLGGVSRMILTGLMFFGRVGGLTLIFAAFSERRGVRARLPQEKITVG